MAQGVKNSKPMAGYDLQRYYDILLVMRKYYRDEEMKKSNVLGNNMLKPIVVFSLYLGLLLYAVFSKNWIVLAFALALMIMHFIEAMNKHASESEFEQGFIKTAIEAGFSRADATEFIYESLV